MMAAFTAVGDTIHVRLADEDRELLGQIPSLLDVVDGERGDPAYEVLHRSAYPSDDDATRSFEAIVAGERAAGRRIDRAVVAGVAGGQETLTRLEALGLLRSMNDARLALAARAGAFDEGAGWERRGRTDPTLAAVMWMAHLQTELIRAVDRLAR